MTGVFSGGCAYTYFEHGNNYGIVKPTDDGIEKKPEFELLKSQFKTVNNRTIYQLYTADVKDYEHWIGDFPEQRANRWYASSDIPTVPGGLDSLVQDLTDEREWEVVDRGVISESTRNDSDQRSPDDLVKELSKVKVREDT